MKKRRVVLSLLLGTSMLLSACGGNGGSDQTADTSSSAGQTDNAANQAGTSASQEDSAKTERDTAADAGSGEVLTITIAKQLDENAGKYDSGDDINNNPMIDLAVEKKGIRMGTALLGGDASNYTTKLRLALTGSEDLPDVFPVYDTQMIADMIESGRAKDITDDVEQYMPERLQEIYDRFPETYYPVTKGGRIYGIACAPRFTEGEVMVIRQD